jgi:hypothetical protein
MESSNLTPPSDREDELEALLRRPRASLPDDGFSARVMATLPANSRQNRSRLWFVIIGGVAGVVFAVRRGASGKALQESVADLSHSFAAVGAVTANPWFWVALGIIALSMIYTLRSHESGFSK